MKIIEEHIECPCKKSSDAYCVYEDGHGYCFSCGKDFQGVFNKVIDPEKVEYQYKSQGNVTQDVMEFYGIFTKVYEGNDYSLGFEWPNSAIKERKFNPENKKDKFIWRKNEQGESGKGLFGMDKFPAGSMPSLTITEGPRDAPAIFQASRKKTAAVAVDSASKAYRDIKENLEYVDSFDKIIICFDPDEPGKEAAKKVQALFQNPRKVFFCELEKGYDPAKYVEDGRAEDLNILWKKSRKLSSDDFIHTFDEISESLHEAVHEIVGEYPFPGIQEALRGFVRGETVVWKGLEGIGKTEVFRACEYHLLKTAPEARIAVIHMEEDKSTTIKGVATYETKVPMYFEEDGIPEEEVLEAYKKAVGDREDRFYIYKIRGGNDPDDILRSVRTLVATSDVDVVFLDNLNKMVDSLEEADERQKLVYLAAKLKDMSMDLRFSLQLISHVNDDGKTLGSRYTAKVADKVVNMTRNIKSTDPIEANTLRFEVEKGRMARRSGECGSAIFDSGSFTLEAA